MQEDKRLRPSGGYRSLRSFMAATVIYDGTVSFCQRFLDPHSRLSEQMTQAARSGRQNIAEGSRASAVSSQTELRLVSVARASLDELLLDYEDFLRQRGLPQWSKDDPRALEVRRVGLHWSDRSDDKSHRSDPTDRSDHTPVSDPTDPSDRTDRTYDRTDRSDRPYDPWLLSPDPAVFANAIICLIHQANYLLDR
jgi:four helix bundle protein